MHFVFVCIFVVSSLFASSYNESLLSIHAKVFPRLLLTDKNIQKKTFDDVFVVYILYNKDDSDTALKLQENILRLYPVLQNHVLKVILQEYKDFNMKKDATAYYLLHSNENNIREINNALDKKKIISFSYEPSYLSLGTLMSLDVAKKVSPFLNILVVKKRKIIFDNILYKIAKIQ